MYITSISITLHEDIYKKLQESDLEYSHRTINQGTCTTYTIYFNPTHKTAKENKASLQKYLRPVIGFYPMKDMTVNYHW